MIKESEVFINGLKINYKIAGEGPAILILHGWGGSSDSWTNTQEILAKKNYKIIVPDLPGFGKSGLPSFALNVDEFCKILEKFISELGLDRFYLLGHSFGGALAVKYALKYPQKIKGLILVGAACFRRKNIKKRISFLAAKIFKIFSFLPFYPLMRRIFYKIFFKKSDYPYFEGVMKESYLKIIKEDLSEDLGKIKVPTFIIWGQKDKIKKLKEGLAINKKIKGSVLKIIPGTGHSPHLEKPELLTREILGFLTK